MAKLSFSKHFKLILAAIYPTLYKKYPAVKIEPIELTVKQQQYEIAQGKIDIGFLTLQSSQKTNDEYIHICYEEIILGVPISHPLAHLGGKLGEKLLYNIINPIVCFFFYLDYFLCIFNIDLPSLC
jgi:DNA-binding transcriptional LysR family regulator